LEFLDKLFAGVSTSYDEPSTPLQANRPVGFCARQCVTAVNRGQAIVPDTAFLLPDGGLVRWVGTFDFMILFRLARVPQRLREVRLGLMANGLTGENADAILRWGIKRGILSWSGQ
jgi:hypothetical protein